MDWLMLYYVFGQAMMEIDLASTPPIEHASCMPSNSMARFSLVQSLILYDIYVQDFPPPFPK